mmetsp:Transcript_75508/g.209812  ORF Transcript_75508/g.209812 Transcript_75508/m.209812 type:complete len:287 (+) Transcript_75508:821-1681(+)
MKIVLSTCFMISSGRSLQAPVSGSRVQISTQAGAAVDPSSSRGRASASAAAAPGAGWVSLSNSSSTSEPARPSPSKSSGGSSSRASSAFRFCPLPLPLPFLPLPLPLPLSFLSPFPSRSVRQATAEAFMFVKLWKEWQPSNFFMIRCKRPASCSPVIEASLPSAFLAASAGSKYSYSRQEHARFASKLCGTFTALKHRISSGSSLLISATKGAWWPCSSNPLSRIRILALITTRIACTPWSVRLERAQPIFCSSRSALRGVTAETRTRAWRIASSTDFFSAVGSSS